MTGKIPFGFDLMAQGAVRAIQRRGVMDVPQSLLAAPPPRPGGLLGQAAMPALYGGLLTAQPSPH